MPVMVRSGYSHRSLDELQMPVMPHVSGLPRVRVGYLILIAAAAMFGGFLYVFNATSFF
jgi:hypothetical protein